MGPSSHKPLPEGVSPTPETAKMAGKVAHSAVPSVHSRVRPRKAEIVLMPPIKVSRIVEPPYVLEMAGATSGRAGYTLLP